MANVTVEEVQLVYAFVINSCRLCLKKTPIYGSMF